MNTLNKILVAASMLSISATGLAQTPVPDSLGRPGDNLNLYGVLYLFKQSTSVENFEQMLNNPDSKVNNLDLNNDGQIDYIRVADYGQNGLHSLVLTDPINQTESQDLAVIEIEQQGNDVVHVQVVGNEDIYGPNYIIEPQDDADGQRTQEQQAPPQQNVYNTYNNYTNYNSGGYYQPYAQPAGNPYSYYPNQLPMVNVWGWPCVQFIFAPRYVYWTSPWRWGYYPNWWNPWRPLFFHTYWRGMCGYMSYYRRGYVNHLMAANHYYYGHRQSSAIVHQNIHNNVYVHTPYGGHREVAPVTGHNGGGRPMAGIQAAPRINPVNAPRQTVNPWRNNAVHQQVIQTPRSQMSMPREISHGQAPRNLGGGGMHMSSGGGGRRR